MRQRPTTRNKKPKPQAPRPAPKRPAPRPRGDSATPADGGKAPITVLKVARPRRAASVRLLSAESWKVAQDAGRLMAAPAPVRRAFLRADAPGYDLLEPEVRTPLSLMIVGGQGGEVRLKVYLTLLWLAAREPYKVDKKPAAAWARLFGLPVPKTNGAQRIAKAIDWLEDHDFVLADRTPGRPAVLTPRHERGRGADYARPDVEENKKIDDKEWYFGLPAELWGKGWMAVLSGAALATLVILLDDAGGRPGTRGTTQQGRGGREYLQVTESDWQWIAETVLADRYRVSHDLWEKGLRELSAHGLVATKLRKELAFGSSHRVRRAKIDWDRLREGPPKPSTVKKKSIPKKKAAPVLRNFD